jgi:UDP-N-acetylglucosamine 2-epimerase
MRFLRIVGARPQFIQAAVLRKELKKKGHQEILLHTGQHYNKNLSAVIFEQLELDEPDVNLEIGSGSHGLQTGLILSKLDDVINKIRPDAVIVDGDTNSTLAGALAAVKMHIPLIHVEAGLRSYDKRMPEEINRIVADHISDLLCAPTSSAVINLSKEGLLNNVELTGDLMFDSFSFYREKTTLDILTRLNIKPFKYMLATLHRAENTVDTFQVQQVLAALDKLPYKVIFPIHPRTENILKNSIDNYVTLYPNISFIHAVGYLDMLSLICNSHTILTDSGGVQREAYFAQVPSIIFRDTTEWIEQVECGWSILAGLNNIKILESYEKIKTSDKKYTSIYGNGLAAEKIVQSIEKLLQ